MIGNIIILTIIAYAVWVFITIGCMGGIRGYRQYRIDRDAMQAQLKDAEKESADRGYTQYRKIFG